VYLFIYLFIHSFIHGPRTWSCRSAYVTLGYHWLLRRTFENIPVFPSRFEATAHLWHLWFICAVYKFTYYTYLLTTKQ